MNTVDHLIEQGVLQAGYSDVAVLHKNISEMIKTWSSLYPCKGMQYPGIYWSLDFADTPVLPYHQRMGVFGSPEDSWGAERYMGVTFPVNPSDLLGDASSFMQAQRPLSDIIKVPAELLPIELQITRNNRSYSCLQHSRQRWKLPVTASPGVPLAVSAVLFVEDDVPLKEGGSIDTLPYVRARIWKVNEWRGDRFIGTPYSDCFIAYWHGEAFDD